MAPSYINTTFNEKMRKCKKCDIIFLKLNLILKNDFVDILSSISKRESSTNQTNHSFSTTERVNTICENEENTTFQLLTLAQHRNNGSFVLGCESVAISKSCKNEKAMMSHVTKWNC